MARKFALNKTELTRLRREEKTFKQFLPVLQLKQEQLQIEELKLRRELAQRESRYDAARAAVESVVPLLAEELPVSVQDLVRARSIRLGEKSVAGVTVPTLEAVECDARELSHCGTPAWVTLSLKDLRELVRLHTELAVLKRQFDLVNKELRRATQKVNLFEKVLIPETKEGIRRIKIALGDEQVAAVGRGKIAKRKQVQAEATRRAAASPEGGAP